LSLHVNIAPKLLTRL